MPGPNRSPNWIVPTRPPGTSDNSAASTAFVASNPLLNPIRIPASNDNGLVVAAGGDANDSYRIGYGYPEGSNGVWLYDGFSSSWRFAKIQGEFGAPFSVQNCQVDGVNGQALVATAIYSIYARFAAANDIYLTLDLSLTAGSFGPAPGTLSGGTGYRFKGGPSIYDFTRRLVGYAKTDTSGYIWRAGSNGVFFSWVLSLCSQQRLNYHIIYTSSTASTSWVEPDSTQYVGAFLTESWDEIVGIAGVVECSSAGSTVSIGISRTTLLSASLPDPPTDWIPVFIHTANEPIPFSVKSRAGNHATDTYFYRVQMKTTAGTASISNAVFEMFLFA